MTGLRPAAELLVPRLRWDAALGFAPAQAVVDEALAVGVGGFVISGGDVAAVRGLARDLRRRSRVPLLIGVDAVRGTGQALEGATGLPPLAALVRLQDRDAAVRAARLTAREARTAGANWVLAPACDVVPEPAAGAPPIPAADPGAVSAVVAAWIQACQAEGVLACARGFPGGWRGDVATGAAPPTVRADAAALRTRDLAPFRAAVGAGVATVLASPAAYPALDASGEPADLSPALLRTLLRKTLRFDGLVASTVLDRVGAGVEGGEGAAAIRAVAAGGDLLVGASRLREVAEALEAAAGDGRLPPDALEQSRRRRRKWAQWTTPPLEHLRPAASDLAWGAALADRALQVARGAAPETRAPVEVATIDDAGMTDEGRRAAPLLEALRRAGVPVRDVTRPTPGGRGTLVIALFGAPLDPVAGAGFSSDATARVLALEADAREAGRPAVIAAFVAPDEVTGLPGDAAIVAAWSGDAAMQQAVARWIACRRPAV